MGGSYADLSSDNPLLATAGSQISAQIQAEGAAAQESAALIQSKISAAHDKLADTFSSLNDSANGFQMAIDGPGGIVDVAQQTVIAANTVAGAVGSITDLVNAASSSPDAVKAAGNAIVGLVVAAAVAGGASAGIGAVIVAGAALVLDVLEKAGLFGNAPIATVCGVDLSWQPTIIVNCAYSNGARRTPTSSVWRTFPEPVADPFWYTTDNSGALSFSPYQGLWRGDLWGCGSIAGTGRRLIDQAFPAYNQLHTEAFDDALTAKTTDAVVYSTSRFRKAYFTAWKANAAFALNGLKAMPDEQVFAQTLAAWNAAHWDWKFIDLTPETAGQLYGFKYAPQLLTDLVNSPPANLTQSGGGFLFNCGPQRANFPPPTFIYSKSSTSTTTSKVLLGTVIIGGLGTALYAHATGQTFGGVFRSAWRGLKRL